MTGLEKFTTGRLSLFFDLNTRVAYGLWKTFFEDGWRIRGKKGGEGGDVNKGVKFVVLHLRHSFSIPTSQKKTSHSHGSPSKFPL